MSFCYLYNASYIEDVWLLSDRVMSILNMRECGGESNRRPLLVCWKVRAKRLESWAILDAKPAVPLALSCFPVVARAFCVVRRPFQDLASLTTRSSRELLEIRLFSALVYLFLVDLEVMDTIDRAATQHNRGSQGHFGTCGHTGKTKWLKSGSPLALLQELSLWISIIGFRPPCRDVWIDEARNMRIILQKHGQRFGLLSWWQYMVLILI